jgi:hypothetical protein
MSFRHEVDMRIFFLLATMLLAVVTRAVAQDKGSAQYYLNQADTYLGREITVQCAAVQLVSGPAGNHPDYAIFEAQTYDRKNWPPGYIRVVVPRASAENFARKYGHDSQWRQNGYATRVLMGIYSKNGTSYYLRWGGAGEIAGEGERKPRPVATPGSEVAPMSFDRSIMPSLTYNGQRYIEVTITSVDASGVKVVDKAGDSVIIPLEQAAKIPELRMRARDAIAAQIKP